MHEGFRIERLELDSNFHRSMASPSRESLAASCARSAAVDGLAAGDLWCGSARGHSRPAPRRALVLLFRAQGGGSRTPSHSRASNSNRRSRRPHLRAGTDAARRAALGLASSSGTTGSGAGAPLARASRALELLAIGFAARPEPFAPAARRPSTRGVALEAALERLGEGSLEHLSLSRFAAGLGFSERQAARLVRERLGCSFGVHVAALRLARAQLLLAESDLPVIEVAAEAGFGSLGHFNQRFRANTGRTPSAFRAAIRAPFEHRRGVSNQAPGPVNGVPPESAARERDSEARSSAFTMLRSHAEKEVLPS
jgi:AraC-like DNA-binding protein